MRIVEKAQDQDGALTQEDLGVLPHCDQRTIRRDIKDLRAKGIHVPTRGFVQDIGPSLSHKAQASSLAGRQATGRGRPGDPSQPDRG